MTVKQNRARVRLNELKATFQDNSEKLANAIAAGDNNAVRNVSSAVAASVVALSATVATSTPEFAEPMTILQAHADAFVAAAETGAADVAAKFENTVTYVFDWHREFSADRGGDTFSGTLNAMEAAIKAPFSR